MGDPEPKPPNPLKIPKSSAEEEVPFPASSPVKWEINESTKTLAESPSKRLRQETEGKELCLEERLQAAAVRREEFRSWVLKKAQTKKPTRKNPEERRAARLEKLRERQMAAEASREAALEAVRMRAATFLARREGARARVNERQETLASRVFESLAAADERRSALQDAERERLKVEHDTVLARLATSRAEAPPELEEARKKLEDRLLAAEEARAASLAQIAARAGEQVQHARDVSALTRQLKLEALAAKRASAEARMLSARQRRAMLNQSAPAMSPSKRSSPCPSPAPSLATDQVTGDAAPGDAAQADAASAVSVLAGAFGSTTSLAEMHTEAGLVDGPSPERVAQEAEALEQAVAEAEAAGAEVAQAEQEVAELMASGEVQLKARDDGGLTSRPAGQSRAAAAARFPASFPVDVQEHEAGDMSDREEAEGGAEEDMDEGAIQARAQEKLEARMEAFRRSCSSRKLQAAWRTFKHKRHTTDALARAFVDTGAISPALKAELSALARAKSSPPPLDQPAPLQQRQQEQQQQQQPGQRPPAPAMVVGAFGGASSGSSRAFRNDSTPLESAKGLDTFDAFAAIVQSPRTLRAASALLHRLEARLVHSSTGPRGGVKGNADEDSRAGPQPNHGGGGASQKSVNKLLRRLFPSLPKDRALERYPPRIFLCALMIQHHPEVVFSGSGPREAALADAACDMTAAFDSLVLRILDPPPIPSHPPPGSSSYSPLSSTKCEAVSEEGHAHKSTDGTQQGAQVEHEEGRGGIAIKGGKGKGREAEEGAEGGMASMLAASPVARSMHDYRHAVERGSSSGASATVGQLLVRFDEAWLHYLDQFAAWKLEDAASLEAELVRVASDMERSMQRKVARSGAAASAANTGATPQGSPVSPRSLLLARSARNLDAVVAQVAHDHRLLRERVARLSGPNGVARLEQALHDVRAEVAQEAVANDWESDLDYISEAPSDSEPNLAAASPSPPRGLHPPHPQPPPQPTEAPQPQPQQQQQSQQQQQQQQQELIAAPAAPSAAPQNEAPQQQQQQQQQQLLLPLPL